MKGLKEYVEKYGGHFTEKLVSDILKNKWSSDDITRTSNRMVYYNVSEASLGDIMFLTNLCYLNFLPSRTHKRRCIRFALDVVSDINSKEQVFTLWVLGNKDFDLTPYI